MFLWTMFTLESFKGLLQQFWVGCAYYLVWAAKQFFVGAMQLYNVFATMALSTDVFDPVVLGNITTKLYTILGVVVLFIVAYNFLLIIIDPDKSNSDLSPEKMLKGIVKVLIIISVLPAIFSFASNFTGSIIESGLIESLLSSSTVEAINNCDGNSASIDNTGLFTGIYRKINSKLYSKAMVDVFISFYDTEGRSPADIQLANGRMKGVDGLPLVIACSGTATSCTFAHAIEESKCNLDNVELLSFSANWALKNELGDNGLTFHIILAYITIGFIGYTLLTFCFDLAIRVIRLAFYQIVAPICVACSILPGSKKDIYTKWRSLVIKNYAMVLVRVLSLSLAVLLLSLVHDAVNGIYANAPEYCNALCKTIILVFLIIAIFVFAKEIPKIVEGLIGDDSGLGKSLTELFKSSGMYTAGAAVGGAVSGAARNAKGAFGNKANWKNKDGKITPGSVIKNVFKGGASTIGGAASGGKRGYSGGKGAGSFKDMANAAANAGRKANEKARKHDTFIKENGGYNPRGIFNSFGKTIKEAGKRAGHFLGINDPYDIEQQVNQAGGISGKMSNIDKNIEGTLDDFAEKGKTFKTQNGNTSELYSKKQKMDSLRDELRLRPGDAALMEAFEKAKTEYNSYKKKMVEDVKQMVSEDEASFAESIKFMPPDIKNFLLETRAQQKDLSAELKKALDSKYIEEVNQKVVIHAMREEDTKKAIDAAIDAINAERASYSSAEDLMVALNEAIELDVDSIKAAINFEELKTEYTSASTIEAQIKRIAEARSAEIEAVIKAKYKTSAAELDARLTAKLNEEFVRAASVNPTLDRVAFENDNMARIQKEIMEQFEDEVRAEEISKIEIEVRNEQESQLIQKIIEKTRASKSIKDTQVERAVMEFEKGLQEHTLSADDLAVYEQLLDASKVTVDRIDHGDVYRSREVVIDGKKYTIDGISKMLKEVGTTIKAEGEYRLAEIAREKDKGSGSGK